VCGRNQRANCSLQTFQEACSAVGSVSIERKARGIKEFLEENESKPRRQRKEVKSNVTDNESAMMYTSHGVIQGYNGQALVDGKHQVIVYGEAFGWGQDYHHVEPVLEGAKENLKAMGKGEKCFAGAILTVDTAYHRTGSIKKCEQEGSMPIYLTRSTGSEIHGLHLTFIKGPGERNSVWKILSMMRQQVNMSVLRESG